MAYMQCISYKKNDVINDLPNGGHIQLNDLCHYHRTLQYTVRNVNSDCQSK